MVDQIFSIPENTKIILFAPFIRDQKGEHKVIFEQIKKAGFARVRVDGTVMDLNEAQGLNLDKQKKHSIDVVVDRILVSQKDRSRLAESLEKALDLGCTDYIKKPFEFKELELKIRQFNKNIFPIKSSLITLSDNYTYDTDSSSLYYRGVIQPFTKNEKTLLALFMLNRNKFITEKQISLALWNNPFGRSTAIRSHICRLRKKLNEDFIQTYRQEGYAWEDNICI
jgi:DNA-binding response OmpR family regulator